MFDVFTQMAALIACGVAWRIWRPLGIHADTSRQSLTGLVYILLLPALVLDVLWSSPLGLDSIRISITAISGILVCMALAWLIYRYLFRHSSKPTTGALILAAAFPNATYMGLPVLEQLLGPEARSIAIQYDLFACTPILLSLGILLAASYGDHNEKASPFATLIRVPPLWAAIIAVILNASGTPMPNWLDEWLGMLGIAVIPLMLISLGLSLQWSAWKRHTLPLLLPVIVLQLAVMPLVASVVGPAVGLEDMTLTGTILEAALPSMVLGLVLCDRYGLHTSFYALAVTTTTAISLITIPFWFNLAG
jgi:predicted permease